MHGHFKILQWVRAEGCPWNAPTCAMASLYGHMDILMWAKSQECPWDERTCILAALTGNLAILQWARSQNCPWNINKIMSRAQPHVQQWLEQEGFTRI